MLINVRVYITNRSPQNEPHLITNPYVISAWGALSAAGEPVFTAELQTTHEPFWSFCVEWTDADGVEHGDISITGLPGMRPDAEKVVEAMNTSILKAADWVADHLRDSGEGPEVE